MKAPKRVWVLFNLVAGADPFPMGVTKLAREAKEWSKESGKLVVQYDLAKKPEKGTPPKRINKR